MDKQYCRLKKEDNEFKSVERSLNIDLVLYPARSEGVDWIHESLTLNEDKSLV